MRAERLVGWWGALTALVAVRVAIPLLQFGHADLPGLPRIPDHVLQGDATGLYAGAREAIAAWGRLPKPALAVLALATVAVAVTLVRQFRSHPRRRPWVVLAGICWLGLLAAANASEQQFSGAGAAGWPLLWSLPMLPLRVIGALDQSSAFWVGVPIAFTCNAVTLVAIAFAALYATGSRNLGLVAAALYSVWPFLTGLLAGHRAWENSTWSIEAGLQMYTEPLTTALVAVALALLLSPQLTKLRLVLAGSALGYATTVKPAFWIFAVAGFVLVAWRLRPDVLGLAAFAAGGLAWVPLLATFWPIGYSELSRRPGQPHGALWGFGFVAHNWTSSTLFTPVLLAIVLPFAAIGIAAVRGSWTRAVLSAWLLLCPALYSVFRYTAIHPRYLFASLPALFVLCAAGGDAVARYGLRAVPSARTKKQLS